MKRLAILFLLCAFFTTGCTKPKDYYTNPNKGGYLRQTTHGICEKCNTHFKASSYQTDHYEKITCPKCGHKQKMNQASQRYAAYKAEIDRVQAIRNQQAIANIVGAVFLGVASGYAEYYSNYNQQQTYGFGTDSSILSTYSPSYYNSTKDITEQSSLNNKAGCWSSFECGVGSKCVKASWEATGICMDTVDRFGIRTYNLSDGSDIGINTDMDGDCMFDTDCPIGFKCDQKYRACIKR